MCYIESLRSSINYYFFINILNNNNNFIIFYINVKPPLNKLLVLSVISTFMQGYPS